jgi:hypothetical protein
MKRKKERKPTLREQVKELKDEIKKLADLVAARAFPYPVPVAPSPFVPAVPSDPYRTPWWDPFLPNPWDPLKRFDPWKYMPPTVVSYGCGTVGTTVTTGSLDATDLPGASWFTGDPPGATILTATTLTRAPGFQFQ